MFISGVRHTILFSLTVIFLLYFSPPLYTKTREVKLPRITPPRISYPIPDTIRPLHSNPRYDTVSIVFIGDMMVHGAQLKAALRQGGDDKISEDYNFSDCFKYISSKISGADYAVANMEFAVGVIPFSGYPSFSAPESFVKECSDIGINLFLAANNHICDKRLRGLDSTYNIYNRMSAGTNGNMGFTGLYKSPEEEHAYNPYITEIGTLKIAFINFTYGTNGIPVSPPYIVNMMDSTHVKEAITRAKTERCDYIIALPHWGEEYTLTPGKTQKEWAAMLNREGVNIIIGSHPHVIQPREITKDTISGEITSVLFYSLGNFISNMSIINSQLGIMVELNLVKDLNSRKTEILEPKIEYIWCARGGKLEENYTVIPIKEFLDKSYLFRDAAEYRKMREHYYRLKKLYE